MSIFFIILNLVLHLKPNSNLPNLIKMKKYMFLILAFVFTAVAFKSNNGGLPVGKQAPSFVLIDTKGIPTKLYDFRGKIVLIDFWASWCKQCRMESPKLVKTYQKYQNMDFEGGSGFEIISIAMDDNLDDWRDAVVQDGYTWTNVSEGKKWDAEIAKDYQVSSLPANYLLDGNGKIIAKDLRGLMLDSYLATIRKK
jgi:thiol-disulfide isomerase/thioredoxin